VRYAPGQVERILAAVPFYRQVTMKQGAFRGVVEDTTQIGVVNVLVTHERVSEGIIHNMAKAIAGNLDKLPQMNPLFTGLKDLFEPLRAKGSAAFDFGGVPLHPGAVRAYKEAGWLK